MLEELSCLAAELSMYLVVSVPERSVCLSGCEGKDDVFYNTQVVFDRRGTIVAR